MKFNFFSFSQQFSTYSSQNNQSLHLVRLSNLLMYLESSGGARGGAVLEAASTKRQSARPTEVTRPPPTPTPDLHPSSFTTPLSCFLLFSVVELIHFDPAQASATAF